MDGWRNEGINGWIDKWMDKQTIKWMTIWKFLQFHPDQEKVFFSVIIRFLQTFSHVAVLLFLLVWTLKTTDPVSPWPESCPGSGRPFPPGWTSGRSSPSLPTGPVSAQVQRPKAVDSKSIQNNKKWLGHGDRWVINLLLTLWRAGTDIYPAWPGFALAAGRRLSQTHHPLCIKKAKRKDRERCSTQQIQDFPLAFTSLIVLRRVGSSLVEMVRQQSVQSVLKRVERSAVVGVKHWTLMFS